MLITTLHMLLIVLCWMHARAHAAMLISISITFCVYMHAIDVGVLQFPNYLLFCIAFGTSETSYRLEEREGRKHNI